jgi:hypothetical protein
MDTGSTGGVVFAETEAIPFASDPEMSAQGPAAP